MKAPATLALLGVLLASPAFAHELGHDHDQQNLEGPELPDNRPSTERVRDLIDRYHETGDDHLLERGWTLLEGRLESENTDVASLLGAAWLAQAGHDFDRARGYLRHVLLLRPDHGEAWLLLGSVALVQGDTATARRACSRTTLAVPVVVTAACFARVEAHDGGGQGARDAYARLAATLSAGAPTQPTLLGWLHGVAADLAGRGGLEAEAEQHYREALALTPTVTVRTGYADLLLAGGRPGAAMELIGPDATAPSLVLRHVLAGMMLGGRGAQDTGRLADIRRKFSSWIEQGDMRHAREMALFFLHIDPDPALAYDLAVRNFEIQREPEDRALLCETAARVGQDVSVACDADSLGRLPMLRAVSSVHGH